MKTLLHSAPEAERESRNGASPAEWTHGEKRDGLLPRGRKKSDIVCCKPIAFWCLNHLLEENELRRQIGEIKEAGFGGFFMHPRAGLLIPYGSTEWFDILKSCIDEARRVGLDAWLYDEDPFPSGMGGGFVTLGRPHLRASTLVPVIRKIEQRGRVVLDLPPGELLGAYLVTREGVTRVDDCAGLIRTDWNRIQLANHSYYPPFSAKGTPHWRANTGGHHLRITRDVDILPATLVAFTREYISKDPWGEYADLLNPEAVSIFLELTHKAYERRFGHEFGETIPGIFTDEPKVMGAFPWSESLEPVFRGIAGEELRDVLPHLVLDIDSRSEWRRWAYREAISRAFKKFYVDRIEEFCGNAGLHFVGHISPEEDPVGQAVYTPGLMSWLGGMGIAGTDLIGSEIGDERHKLLHLGPKLASSAAHSRGKNLVLCEAFAVTDWVLDPAWMGKAINWLYALGVNMLTPHGQFYSIDGPRKREAPPSEFFQASYWEHFPAISAYVENLSLALREGRHEAPVALYYPCEAFMAWAPSMEHSYIPSEEAAEKSEALRGIIGELIDLLLISGYDFDLLDAEALGQAQVKDGRLALHDANYSVLVVPGGCLRDDSAEKLNEFAAAGLPVVSLQKTISVLGGAPYHSPTATSLACLGETLNAIILPVFRSAGRLIGHKRQTASGAVLFLMNNGDRAFAGKVILNFAGPYEIVDPQDDSSCGTTAACILDLAPGQGVLIRQSRSHRALKSAPLSWRTLFAISDGWKCRVESPNTLILQEFRVLAGSVTNGLDEISFLSAPVVDLLAPSLENFSWPEERIVSFWTTFECRKGLEEVFLVRDGQFGPPSHSEFSENYRFFINGMPVGPFVRHRRYDPWNFQCEFGGMLRDGRNSLVIEQTLPDGLPGSHRAPYDAVRLFGDFCVEFPYGRSIPAVLTPRPAEFPSGLPRLSESLGHSQYGGILIYSQILPMPDCSGRFAIRLEELYESVEVLINGLSCGVLWKKPYRLELVQAFFKEGANFLELRCSSSPANYLQGMRRPAGLGGKVFLEVAGS